LGNKDEDNGIYDSEAADR